MIDGEALLQPSDPLTLQWDKWMYTSWSAPGESHLVKVMAPGTKKWVDVDFRIPILSCVTVAVEVYSRHGVVLRPTFDEVQEVHRRARDH